MAASVLGPRNGLKVVRVTARRIRAKMIQGQAVGNFPNVVPIHDAVGPVRADPAPHLDDSVARVIQGTLELPAALFGNSDPRHDAFVRGCRLDRHRSNPFGVRPPVVHATRGLFTLLSVTYPSVGISGN